MKDENESYLDSLLENISGNSDNSFNTMIDNDADSFQLDEDTFDDLDFNNFDDDLSFDLDDNMEEFNDFSDFKGMEPNKDLQEPVHEVFDAVDDTNDPIDLNLDKPNVQMNVDEKEPADKAETDETYIEQPVYEEPDIEGLFGLETANQEPEFEEPLQEASNQEDEMPIDVLSDSYTDDDLMETFLGGSALEEPEVQPEEEGFDPMGDVEDLLGMLEEEESNGDSYEIEDEPMMQEPEEDIFSFDGILDEDVPSTLELEGAKKDKKVKADKKKDKISIWKKLFGNVHDEKAKAKAKKSKGPVDENGNPITKPKKSKEEIKAEKAEKKKQQDEAKKENDAKKANAKAIKEAQKQEKAEKKKEKKAQTVVEEDEGRINRVGSTIVFLFLGAIALSVVFGTDSFSYSQSVKNATQYFGKQKYNSAYEEVRGIEVKEKDYEIYDKIMTVMFVNKQFNSYNNYYNMNMYPEALDSLLKGLQRYDEYLSLAKELGIKSDLDFVRGKILGELNSVFTLSEEDSYHIIQSENQQIYSEKVIKAASIE